MKTFAVLPLLALVASLSLFLPSRTAQAVPLGGGTPTPGGSQGDEGGSKLSDCLQKCFDQYNQNVRDCKETCWVCTFSILGICISGHHDEACLTACRNLASEILEECKAECVPPPQP